MQDSKSLRAASPALIKSLFRDFANTFPSLKDSLNHDHAKLVARIEHEGVEFLTVALPKFWKSVLTGLESGHYSICAGFQRKHGSRRPLFLQGLTAMIFNDEGELLDDPDSNAIAFIGQLCQLFYKLELPSKKTLEEKVIQNFKDTEVELSSLLLDDDCPILGEAQAIMRSIFKGFNLESIKTPKHGPGAVATGEKDINKWDFKRKYESIHRVFPYYDWFVPTRDSLFSRLNWYKSLKPEKEGIAKVILVPKDSRGPRLISAEPLEFMFIQQAIKKAIYEHIESPTNLVYGQVNFTDQRINQREAQKASITRSYATLDLKEASDRVSLLLVKKLFSGTGLLQALLGTRTALTKLPDGTTLRMKKFAPMGSALCFPVEALCFWALAESLRRMWRIPGKIYVFGDDMIVPKRLVPYLFEFFPQVGLKFNQDKCFVEGFFRESCGMDAYNGVNVVPQRMKKLWPKSRSDAMRVQSAVDFVNRLFMAGYWCTAGYLEDLFVRTYGLKLPVAPARDEHFSGLSWKTFQDGYRGERSWNSKFQRWEYLTYSVETTVKKKTPSQWNRLFANLVGQMTRRVPVPHAGKLKMRWCA